MRQKLLSRVLGLIAACAPLVLPAIAAAEVPPALLWSRTYANPSLDGDHLWDMAQGGCNRVAVVGTAHWPTASAQGEVRVYDGSGGLVWADIWPAAAGGSEGLAVAIDAAGNTAAAGIRSGDIFVRRYNPAGTLLWSRTYKPATDYGNDYPGYITTDPATNDIIVGGAELVGSSYNWALRKLDAATGATLWTYRYDGPNGTHDMPSGVAVDATGAVYAAGYHETATQGRNVRVIKLTSAGATVWETTFNGPGNGEDTAMKAALLPNGNLQVTGVSTNASGNHDVLTMVVNTSTGAILWTRLYNGPTNSTDRGYNVGSDSAGNVYSSGWQSTPAGAGWVVVKYDSAGTLLWTLTYAGYGAGLNEALGMIVDPCDNLYVSGHEQGPTGLRWMVRKYDKLVVTTTPPPPPPVEPGTVKIVGGVRGYLNPKNGEQATIIVKPSGAGDIKVRIYDRLGRLVREIAAVATGNGAVVLKWNATDATGQTVPAGIYPIIVEAPGVTYQDKLAVLR